MLVSLSGYSRSGKDTVAEILNKCFGYVRYAFADKVKEYTLELGLWDGSEENKVEPLVKVGMAARKVFGEDFWLKQVVSNPRFIDDIVYNPGIVITDCRFINEFEGLRNFAEERNQKFISIWIDREGAQPKGIDSLDSQWIKSHVDWRIDNNSTLEDLERLVLGIIHNTVKEQYGIVSAV